MKSDIDRESAMACSEQGLGDLPNSVSVDAKVDSSQAYKNGGDDADGNADLRREDGGEQADRDKDQEGKLESPEDVNAQGKEMQLGTQYRSGFKVVHGNNAASFEQFRKFDPWAALTEDQKLEAHKKKFYAQVDKLATVLKIHYDSGGENPFITSKDDEAPTDVVSRRAKRIQEFTFTKDEEELDKKLNELKKMLSPSQWQGILDCFAVKDCLLRGEAEELAERFRISPGVEENNTSIIENKKDGLKTVGSQIVDEIFKTMRWKASVAVNYIFDAYQKSKEESEDLPADIVEGERLATQNVFSIDDKVQQNVRIWEEEQASIAAANKQKRKQELTLFFKEIERLIDKETGSLDSSGSAQAFLDLISSPSTLNSMRRRHCTLGVILSTVSEVERRHLLREAKKPKELTGDGAESALKYLCSSSTCRRFFDVFIDMLEKARRECSDVSSSVRPYLTTLLSLAQVCEYGNVPFAKVRYVRQSKITSVLGDFAESKSMSSSVRSIAMQLRRKWHLEQMSAVAYAPLNTVFKVADVRIGNNTTSTKKEEREKVEPRGGELRGTSVDKPTYMKGTKLERQIRARLQKGDVVSVSSVADLDSRKGLIAEPSSNQDQLKSKPKETTHSDPRINALQAMLTILQGRIQTMENLCTSWSTPIRISYPLVQRVPTRSEEMRALNESIRIRKILKGNGPPQSANKDIRDPDFPDSTSNDPYLVISLDDDTSSQVAFSQKYMSAEGYQGNKSAAGRSQYHSKRSASIASIEQSASAKAQKVGHCRNKVFNPVTMKHQQVPKPRGVSASSLQDLKKIWKI